MSGKAPGNGAASASTATRPGISRPAPGCRLSAASHCHSEPQWSFSKTSTFRDLVALRQKSPAHSKHRRNEFSPAATTAPTSFRSSDQSEADENWRSLQEESVNTLKTDSRSNWDADAKKAHFDGSLDRFLDDRFQDGRERAAHPRAKSYDPAQVIGKDTAPAYARSPQFSFGGGKSRWAESRKKSGVTSEVLNEVNEQLRRRAKPKLSRGFGSAPRLQHRGSAYELPDSPGPSAYNIPRDHEEMTRWSTESLTPWGRRTAKRPDLANATASDVAPGEYTADHPFLAGKPSPLLGHRLKELRDEKDDYPDPARYTIATSIGAGMQASIGRVPRPAIDGNRIGRSPGLVYDQGDEAVLPDPFHATFGRSERRHVADEVDPDEPPGPGSHKVRKDATAADKPSAGLPREEKLKKVHGQGPAWIPSPAEYSPKVPKGKSFSMAKVLSRPLDPKPAPTDYVPSDSFTAQAPPAWGPMANRSAARRTFADIRNPYGEEGAASGNKQDEDRLVFAPSSPKYSMVPRRPLPGSGPDPCGPLMGQASTVGC